MKMSELDMDLEEIRRVMDYEPTAEENLERRVDFIIRELDELCRMATNHETVDLVQGQSFGLGQIQTRIQLVLSFLATRKPTQFRIVRNA